MDEILQIDVNFEEEGVRANNMCLTQIGPNLYRLEETPVFIESVSYKDVIEADKQPDGSLLFCQVVQKSDLRTYDLILSKEIVASEELAIILDKVTALGGHWERIFGGCLFIYLPANTDYDPVDEINRVNSNLEQPRFMSSHALRSAGGGDRRGGNESLGGRAARRPRGKRARVSGVHGGPVCHCGVAARMWGAAGGAGINRGLGDTAL